MKRLPDSEFAVLQAVWQLEEPITSAKIMAVLDNDKDWKLQTLLTLLARLTEKGFLQSTRVGRERHYQALVSEEDYMAVETSDFLSRFRGNAFGHVVKTLFNANNLSDEDLDDIKALLDRKEGQ